MRDSTIPGKPSHLQPQDRNDCVRRTPIERRVPRWTAALVFVLAIGIPGANLVAQGRGTDGSTVEKWVLPGIGPAIDAFSDLVTKRTPDKQQIAVIGSRYEKDGIEFSIARRAPCPKHRLCAWPFR